MSESSENVTPSAKERVSAVLDTLKQPEVITDLAVGAAGAGITALAGGGPEASFAAFVIVSNAAGPIRGELQSGNYGGSGLEDKRITGGEWYHEGDHRMVVQRFVKAIKTGESW